MKGFVKIPRAHMAEVRYLGKAYLVYLHLAVMAQFAPGKFRGTYLRPGQVKTGAREIAREIGLDKDEVEYALRKLVANDLITRQGTNKYSLITLTKWNLFAGEKSNVSSKSHTKKPGEDAQSTPSKERTKNNQRRGKETTPPSLKGGHEC